MSRGVRLLAILFAAVIVLVFIPMAMKHVPAHGIVTKGPAEIPTSKEAGDSALPPKRGPGTGAKEAAEDPGEYAPESVVFDQRQKEMAAAVFDHFLHASNKKLNIACTDCHHKSEGTDVSAACSECHGDAHSGDMFSAKAAQHKSCIGCHVKTNAAKEAGTRSAPVGCEGCHKGDPAPKP